MQSVHFVCYIFFVFYQTSMQETTGVAPLHIACDQGHLDVVTELLGAGTNVNQLTFDSITSLYFATKANHREVW